MGMNLPEKDYIVILANRGLNIKLQSRIYFDEGEVRWK